MGIIISTILQMKKLRLAETLRNLLVTGDITTELLANTMILIIGYTEYHIYNTSKCTVFVFQMY